MYFWIWWIKKRPCKFLNSIELMHQMKLWYCVTLFPSQYETEHSIHILSSKYFTFLNHSTKKNNSVAYITIYIVNDLICNNFSNQYECSEPVVLRLNFVFLNRFAMWNEKVRMQKYYSPLMYAFLSDLRRNFRNTFAFSLKNSKR